MSGPSKITHFVSISIAILTGLIILFSVTLSSASAISKQIFSQDISNGSINHTMHDYTNDAREVITGTFVTHLPIIQRLDFDPCMKITTDTTWGIAGSPYVISCDVFVTTGATLTIEPGVTVQFEGPEDDLLIAGSLQATGTHIAPILFEPITGTISGSWGRVELLPRSQGNLEFVTLEYGGSTRGMLYIASNDVQVKFSTVRFSANTGIYIQDSSPVIIASDIVSNTGTTGCGLINDSGSPLITKNNFIGNFCAFDVYPTSGGGLFNDSGNPDILTNVFYNNQASNGSGIYNGSGNPNIEGNMFKYNSSHPEVTNWLYCYGGGIYNDSGSPDIKSNIFQYNSAYGTVTKNSGAGGGLYNVSGSPIIKGNSFVWNYAAGVGGGLANGVGYPVIENNVFDNNTASGFVGKGGGIYTNGNPIIQANVFINNKVEGMASYGGGLACESGNPLIQNNFFGDNQTASVDSQGGGVYCFEGSPIIRNNTFYGNSTQSESTPGIGGGIAVYNAVDPQILSNIVISNTAGQGGGIYADNNTGLLLDYNDVWNNMGGNYGNVITGTHDISADPLLVDPGHADFHLSPGSPCIDKGDPENYPPFDYAGNPRPNGAAPDIGAYEYYATLKQEY